MDEHNPADRDPDRPGPVLITGAAGLVGSALVAAGGAEVRGLTRSQLDITDVAAVERVLDEVRPRVVINAAAQAKVDLAEEEPDWTEAVNHLAVAHLARSCRRRGIRLVHLGTDYSLHSDQDLTPDMAPDPLGQYAGSKSRGEQAAVAEGAVVVRIQWVYGDSPRSFFGRTLAAFARGEEVALVTDQVGCPTPAVLLAPALLRAADGDATGLFHLACPGETTPWRWLRMAATLAGLPFNARPISRAELGGALRPARSVLDSRGFAAAFGVVLPPWEVALRHILADVGMVRL